MGELSRRESITNQVYEFCIQNKEIQSEIDKKRENFLNEIRPLNAKIERNMEFINQIIDKLFYHLDSIYQSTININNTDRSFLEFVSEIDGIKAYTQFPYIGEDYSNEPKYDTFANEGLFVKMVEPKIYIDENSDKIWTIEDNQKTLYTFRIDWNIIETVINDNKEDLDILINKIIKEDKKECINKQIAQYQELISCLQQDLQNLERE